MTDESTLAGRALGALGTLGRAALGTVRPRRPEPALFAALPDAPLPRPRGTVRVTALPQRANPVPSLFVVEGLVRPWRTDIGYTTFVLEHPRARLLVDPAIREAPVRPTGLEAMRHPLRTATAPPARTLSSVAGLERARIAPGSLDAALVTHLHSDHVQGLEDLPGLELLVHRPERAWAERTRPVGVAASLAGRPQRLLDLDGPAVLTFERSHDLFGDGTVVLVDLAGHTPGSIGVLAHTETGWLLLAGDAVWNSAAVDLVRPTPAIPGEMVDSDRDEAFRSVHRLHAVRDRVRVIPSHDLDLTRDLCVGALS